MRLLVILALTVILFLVRAIVCSMLWGWFVVPVFHTPALTVSAACGLTILAMVFLPEWGTNWDEQSDEQKVLRVMEATTISVWFLFAGWIVHLFM